MNTFLNSLHVGDILHRTARGVEYIFIGLDANGGVRYSINQNQKTLPLPTILAALNAENEGLVIDRRWYRNFNEFEFRTRPCNMSVLRNILFRYRTSSVH